MSTGTHSCAIYLMALKIVMSTRVQGRVTQEQQVKCAAIRVLNMTAGDLVIK